MRAMSDSKVHGASMVGHQLCLRTCIGLHPLHEQVVYPEAIEKIPGPHLQNHSNACSPGILLHPAPHDIRQARQCAALIDSTGKQAEAAACWSVSSRRTEVSELAEQTFSQVLPLHAPTMSACCNVGLLSRPTVQRSRAIKGMLPQQS